MHSREEDALQALVLPKNLAVKACPEAQSKNKAGFQALMELQVYLLISQDLYAARHNGAHGTADFIEEAEPSVLGWSGALPGSWGEKTPIPFLPTSQNPAAKMYFKILVHYHSSIT